jgi:hypothetical protein
MKKMLPVLYLLVGIVAGASIFGTRPAKAQFDHTTVYVTEHNPPFTGSHTLSIPGKQVVSFSCIREETGTDCFIVSQ